MAHRRAVHAVLRLLDARAAEMLRWITDGGRKTGTMELEDDLDPLSKARIRARLEALHSEVGRAAMDLGMPPDRMELSRQCRASLGIMWEMAPDLRSRRMKGYGTVPEHLSPELSALADRLERILLELLDLAEAGSR